MKKKIYLMVILFFAITAHAQNIDSLISLIYKEKTDSARIGRFYDLQNVIENMNPAQAIKADQQVLALAKKQKDRKLEAAITSELGLDFYYAGNTVQGTHIMLEAVKMAEETDDAQVIGITYQNLAQSPSDAAKRKELYEKALRYSTLGADHFTMCFELLGEARYYLRRESRNLDSALYYTEKCYQLALAKDDQIPLVLAEATLSTIHRLMGSRGLALEFLRSAERVPCVQWKKNAQYSVYEGYSEFYLANGQTDSAFFYAYKRLACSKGAWLLFEMWPVNTLRHLYTDKNSDSALKYTNRYIAVKDSLQKTEALSQSQAMMFDEDLRQEKLETTRHHNLQYAAIAIGLIVFTMLFLLFSHSVIASARVITSLGIFSLLLVFEFINLLIHPYLGALTHESPVIMLGFMVCIAALLIPLHHKLEHWVIHKLIEKNNKIRLAKAKKVIEQLEGKESKAHTEQHTQAK